MAIGEIQKWNSVLVVGFLLMGGVLAVIVIIPWFVDRANLGYYSPTAQTLLVDTLAAVTMMYALCTSKIVRGTHKQADATLGSVNQIQEATRLSSGP